MIIYVSVQFWGPSFRRALDGNCLKFVLQIYMIVICKSSLEVVFIIYSCKHCILGIVSMTENCRATI